MPDPIPTDRAIAITGATVRVVRYAGFAKAGWIPSATAAVAFALLRRGRGAAGVGLLGAAAGVVWLRRSRRS